MKYKSEVTEYLEEYIAEAKTYNLKVSKICCDNGGEYISINLKNYCKNKRIVIDYIIPDTPELNGKAERFNRTLLEKARAMIFDSNINKEFGGKATYAAVFLLNCSPTEATDKTPIEKWTGNKQDLSGLQIFGSEAYVKILGDKQKLELGSKKHIFVGYAPVGYRLWNEDLRKIIISRDVIFKIPEERTNDKKSKNWYTKGKGRYRNKQQITDNESITPDKNSKIELEDEHDQRKYEYKLRRR